MTAEEFKQIVQKFADRKVDVELGGRTLVAEVQGQILEVTLDQKGGLLYCKEGGREETAESWIIRRLGNLDILANRILEFVIDDKALVPVEAELTGVVDSEDSGAISHVEDVVNALPEMVNSLPAASTNIIYLTSDAGEGKTCVLEALARLQARAFLDRRSDWILLPIGLAGRPFMRLDEVIVAALANVFRFRYLYYEAILELVKRKVIVLGLDGFEEMFIESQTGEVASSLGNLVSKLDSQGTLIFAARKAYYHYSNLEAQAKLFKAIRNMNVAFGEAQLQRWKKNQFIQCCEKYGMTTQEANGIFDGFCTKLSSDHPVLTRAVLARRAIKEVVNRGGGGESTITDILGVGDTSPESVFERFVNALIHREATEKWIDRTGEAAAPLLTLEEHRCLLMSIAEEMWIGGTDFLSWNVIEETTEVVVDSLGKSPSTVRQAKERIQHHALLQRKSSGNTHGFDHEEFRTYFLGCRLRLLLVDPRPADIRRFLSVRILPELTVRVAVRAPLLEEGSISSVLGVLKEVASAGPRSSFGRINAASLLVRIISGAGLHDQQLKDMYFPAEMVSGLDLRGIHFEECLFERISLRDEPLRNVEFRSCTIVELVCLPDNHGNSGSFDSMSIPDVIRTGFDDKASFLYSPKSKRIFLQSAGFKIIDEAEVQAAEPEPEMDERVNDVEKVVRAFSKATQVNSNILAMRLGRRWNEFERKILSELIRCGVLVEVRFEGSGQQRRFKLGVGFDEVARARRLCGGDFKRFLDELQRN